MQASNILMAWELLKDMLFAAFYYAISPYRSKQRQPTHHLALQREESNGTAS
jgi:hypothetical protein